MMTPKPSALTRLPERIFLAMACAPFFFAQIKMAVRLRTVTTIKTDIQGHHTTPTDASKYQFGKSGTLRGCVTAARKQTLAFDSSRRQNHVPPLGGFPGTEPVVDPAIAVRDLAARPGPITADTKTWVYVCP